MKLPNREHAHVASEKLTEYLLSESHPVGGNKAEFFRYFGFTDSNWELLQDELLRIAHEENVQLTEQSRHGTKYVVTGLLSTPLGRNVEVKTIWIIETDSEGPRFVTAYPA